MNLSQLDVTTAYLNGKVDTEIYMVRISIGLVSVLAATNFHGIFSLGSSWGMIPDPLRGFPLSRLLCSGGLRRVPPLLPAR